MNLLRLFSIAIVLSMASGVHTAFAADDKVVIESNIVEEKGPTVTVSGTHIDMWSDKAITFEIYSITGQLIKSVNVPASTHVKIELPKGFYIVKCESWTRRVMVK